MNELVTESQRRLVLPEFLTPEQCKELEFIHISNSTVGYRPNVFSTTLLHLIATDCAQFIIPLIPIREKIKEKIEEFFHCEFELFVEFTGLISWTSGASIGWHSDDNRPYLKQRHFSAVCYLNTYNENFKGGLFHFRDGEPSTISPKAGDVVIYTSDESNVHSVDEILEGERLTLALWFTKDVSHDEDANLLSLLQNPLNSTLPIPSSMYWVSQKHDSEELGFDLCYGRIHSLGFDVYSSEESWFLACKDEQFESPFASILHLLQVLQFYKWKEDEVKGDDLMKKRGDFLELKQEQKGKISEVKCVFLKDHELLRKVLGDVLCSCVDKGKCLFDWEEFSSVVVEFDEYCCKLRETLIKCLPLWKELAMIYYIE